jgi:ribosomal protein S18 acetylase RimI-like enzyme
MRKTTADLILRPRLPSDDGFIYRLSDRIFAPYSRHPTGSMASMLSEHGALVFVADTRAVIVAPAHPDPDACAPGRPAGFFVLGFDGLPLRFGPWQRPAVARLNAIGVQPDLHGRGVGRFLLEHAEAVARDAGAVSLTLMTAETNARARRLFVAAGFQRLFSLEQAYARGQRGIVMTKLLAI